MLKSFLRDFLEKREIVDRMKTVLETHLYHTVFQPIVKTDSLCVVGYEALIRFHYKPDRSVTQWFDDANRVASPC